MMHIFSSLSLLVGSLISSTLVQAAPPSLDSRASTCNTPSNRACWTSTFNINTDYETSIPLTGITRPVGLTHIPRLLTITNSLIFKYTLVITEVDSWLGPDGVVKEKVMLINSKI